MDFFFPEHPNWKPVDDETVSAMKTGLSGIEFSSTTKIQGQVLPFYPESMFLIAKDEMWAPRNVFVYALYHGGECILLNGTSPPIHEFNGKGHILIDDDNVIDYLSFFCFFVHGDEGPFYIARSLDAPYLPDIVRNGAEEEHAELVERFNEIFQSVRTFGRSDKNAWRLSATIFYSNAIFIGDFEVQPSGISEMLDDNPVMADLPSKIDAPLVPEEGGKVSIH